MIVVLAMTIMSILIAKKKDRQLSTFQVILDEQGVCSFEKTLENSVDSNVDIKEQYQLLSSSRYSFFGCWLHMAPLSNMYSPELLTKVLNKKHKKKWLFIYRDSLSTKDFSRVSQVIRKLKNSS
jgi:hypothetical protein